MTTAERNAPGASVLRIEGELNIYRAAELKALLLARLGEAAELEIDLSGVTEIDTAGVQLLMMAKKAAQAGGGELHLSGHSAAVLDVLDLLNLAGYFGDPLLIPPSAGGARQSAAR